MYAIRVRAGGEVLEAAFSGSVNTSEALRAVSQAFSLAEAGNISRAVCDLRQVEDGPTPGTLSIIAASFAARIAAGQRVAMLCSETQIALTRQFARFTHVGEELGVFTREADADAWLATPARSGISSTALRQMGVHQMGVHQTAVFPVVEPEHTSERRAHSA